MNDCRDSRRLIADFQAGDIDADDLVTLEAHCRDCPDCRALMSTHDALLALGDSVPLPEERYFARMRDGVFERIDHPERRVPPDQGSGSFWADLRTFLNAHPMAAAPAVLAVLVTAVFLGRWSVSPSGYGGDALMHELSRQAALRQDVTQYLDNPLSYTNVSVRPRGDRLALSFDVMRHVDVETDLDSPIARDVLLATIVDGPGGGQRLRAIQLASDIDDVRLLGALTFTLHNDPELAVRLEALDALVRSADRPLVREALLHTLGADPSVQMRLLALEHLAGRRVDQETLERAITNQRQDGDAALLQRTAQLQRRES